MNFEAIQISKQFVCFAIFIVMNDKYLLNFSRASSSSSIHSADIMGTAERSFLTPRNLQEGDLPENMPSLDEFDAEIDIYRVCTS